MSLQCYDFAMPKEALALARSAYAGATGAPPRVAAMLALREARAYAALGDRSACEPVLAQAESLFGRSSNTDDPAWLGHFDESEFNAQVGTCYLDLKNPRKAESYFAKTLRQAPPTKVRDRATYIIRRASAQTQLGNRAPARS